MTLMSIVASYLQWININNYPVLLEEISQSDFLVSNKTFKVGATMKTDDGALVYAAYTGLIILAPDVLARIMGGEDVPLAEYYFYTNPMFQTAAENYAWLNPTIAVGRGKVVPGGVEYRVWTVSDPA